MKYFLRIRSVLVLFGGTFGSAFFTLLTQLILARLLIVTDYGRLATLVAVVNLLTAIASFGVNWFWVQAFGREGYGGFRWVRPSVLLLAGTNFASLILLAGYIMLNPAVFRDGLGFALAAGCLMLLGQSVVEIASVKFQLEERFGQLALWQTLLPLGRLAVAGLLGLVVVRSLPAVLTGYAAVALAVLLGGLAIGRKFQTRQVHLAGHIQSQPGTGLTVRPATVWNAAKLSLPFTATTLCYAIYFQSAILLIAWILGPRDTAIFNASLLFLSAINLVPNVIFTKFLFVRICRWAEHDRESFEAILHVGVAGMIVAGVLLMVAVAAAAPIVVPLVFGAKYNGAISLLVWLTPTIPLRFVQSAYSAMLVSERNARRRVTYGTISAVCSLAINLVLLPIFGLVGAVAASIASEAVMLGFSAWAAARHLDGVRLGATFNVTEVRTAFRRIVRPATASTP